MLGFWFIGNSRDGRARYGCSFPFPSRAISKEPFLIDYCSGRPGDNLALGGLDLCGAPGAQPIIPHIVLFATGNFAHGAFIFRTVRPPAGTQRHCTAPASRNPTAGCASLVRRRSLEIFITPTRTNWLGMLALSGQEGDVRCSICLDGLAQWRACTSRHFW